ncbi:MAG: hypothetical protein HXX14_11610 [Bacteroidetes bacterium]|nr:hypothetical protein [Bacteroidota bacterium]
MENSRFTIKNKFSISLNSLGYFLLSYLFVYLLHQFVTCLTANIFNIPTILSYNEVSFLADKSRWTYASVQTIFLSGPIATLFCGIFFLIIAYRFHDFDGLLRLFFLWGALHSFNLFFGALIIGAFTGQGMGFALNWMYLMDSAKLVIVILAILCMMVIGAMHSRMFLFTANSYFAELRKDRKSEFLRLQLFYPFIFGSLLLYFIKIPVTMTDLLLPITLLFLIVPIFSRQQHFPSLTFNEETPHSIKSDPLVIIITIFVVIVFRIIFAKGISF